jgi:hypothetical protein
MSVFHATCNPRYRPSQCVGYVARMAVTESREILIEATPAEILDVLYDLESLTEWSPAHQEIEVLERDAEGRPSRSRQVVKIVGINDEQELARVRFDITVDPIVPLPGFLIKRGAKGLLETATEGLRARVLEVKRG